MNDYLFISLSSWIIEDGNYKAFKQGDQIAFALEFFEPTLSIADVGYKTVELKHLFGSTYRIQAKVLHIRDVEWWAVDAGVRMYRSGWPSLEVKEGDYVSGEVSIGVDPFDYKDHYSRHHTAPGLIYDWLIEAVDRDGSGDSLVRCELLDGLPRR